MAHMEQLKNLISTIRKNNHGFSIIGLWNQCSFKYQNPTNHWDNRVGVVYHYFDYIENIGYDKIQEIEEDVVSYAREELSKLDYLELYMTPNKENHSSVISFNIKGVHPHDVASILDSEGICVRSRKPLCSTSNEIFRN